MNNFSPIPAKLLLFGEHSVLIGSPAVLVPLNDFTASLKFPSKEPNHDSIVSNAYLKRFSSYIHSNSEWFSEHIYLEEFDEALKDGLYLDSDIPEGYGLGSSASVCVAVYKAFGISDFEDPAELKLFYSRLESFFHGKSSGIDPLTIHARKPVVIEKDKIRYLDTDQKLFAPEINVYLLDSGISRNAGEIIRLFKASLITRSSGMILLHPICLF
ncbi:MAG: hypothetical protein HC905_25220 [Bacteroidales bacterium]|nr:hypothetical protein [Bacteroidales bacterium]